jgi:glycosyltransferase involved in cell wall biosynthesis
MIQLDNISKTLERPTQENALLVVAGIPAYNEEKTIARVVLGAQQHADVVIVCDDGSKDLTGVIAERLGAVVVTHERNLGYGAALKSLFKKAKDLKADVLVTLDSDGQHDPSEILGLVKPIADDQADVVLGSRFKETNGTADMPTYRRFGIKVITKLVKGSSNHEISDAQSGYRAYNRIALERLSMLQNGMTASIELLREISKSGLRVCEVPVSCKYASSVGGRTSKENPVTHGLGLLMYLIQLVVEDRPLLFLGIPGILSLGAGTIFGVWMMQLYAFDGEITTNIALASIAFILIGFFLVSTAITLYAIARIANRMKIN